MQDLSSRLKPCKKKGNYRGLISQSNFTLLIFGAVGIPSKLIIWSVEGKKEEVKKRHQLSDGEPLQKALDQT